MPKTTLQERERIEDVEEQLRALRASRHGTESLHNLVSPLLSGIKEHRDKMDAADRERLGAFLHRVADQL